MSLGFEIAALSDPGCVRSNNEDCFGYDESYGIYVVCDGMGGAAAGEVASRIAVDSVLAFFRGTAIDKPGQPQFIPSADLSARAGLLENAIQFANYQIHSTAAQNPGQQGMGSTIVAVLIDGQLYSVAHAGDSRVYLLRRGAMQQVTQDHSLVMEQLRRGLITATQARNSEIQNVITRALGAADNVEPDLRDMTAEPGDMLLLASDGLTRDLSDETILAIIENASSCKLACERLIDAARKAGGHDNITCMLVRFPQKF
jgi:protein phosphatase